jgi:hypothetical protein
VSDPKKNFNMYNADPISNNGVGWILATMFFLDSIGVGIALQRMGDQCVRGGIKIRSALMTAVGGWVVDQAPAVEALLKSTTSPVGQPPGLPGLPASLPLADSYTHTPILDQHADKTSQRSCPWV